MDIEDNMRIYGYRRYYVNIRIKRVLCEYMDKEGFFCEYMDIEGIM